eukprot:TRINITY_DN3440_c0_g1_i1.p1 TRINITY_DN3440_c0_g1~~TRINITY_DN3440_c0_g1_i1.p1  ORF type:complete len:612 (+),score=141.07 TRINITY_DN3440_c0_g1_i1:29-1864(+)
MQQLLNATRRAASATFTAQVPQTPQKKCDAGAAQPTAESGARQLQYFEKARVLWDKHRCCDTVRTAGQVDVTVFLAQGSTKKSVKFDLGMTTTEMLEVALKEFGRKVVEQDASLFRLLYKPGSQESSSDSYFLPEGAPLFLLYFGPQDIFEIVRKQKEPSQEDEEYASHMLVKVVVPDQNVATTINIPSLSTVESVIETINSFNWSALDLPFHPIRQSHLQCYYELSVLTPTTNTQSPAASASPAIEHYWTSLDNAMTLQYYDLPQLCILALSRKQEVEIEFVQATGPFSGFVRQNPNNVGNPKANSEPATHQSDSTLGDEENDDAEHTDKLYLPLLETSVGEAMCSIIKWLDARFGDIPWAITTLATSPPPSKAPKPIAKSHIQSRPTQSRPSCAEKRRSGCSVGGDTDEEEDDEEAEKLQQNGPRKSRPVRPLPPTPSKQQTALAMLDDDADVPTAETVPTSSPPPAEDPSLGSEFRLKLGSTALVIDRSMLSVPWNVGDSLELRMGVNAIQFAVTCTPATKITASEQNTLLTGIELEGETVIVGGIHDVRHVYVAPTAAAGVSGAPPTTVVPGCIYITNFQLLFVSYQHTQARTATIPFKLETKSNCR